MTALLRTPFLMLLGAFTIAAQGLAEPPGVAWQHDLDQAREAAAASGKLVLVHFWTETCGPCKRLDKTVFNQPTVAAAVEEHFVPVKINAATASELAKSLRINRVPTDIVMTPDGKVLDKLISPATPIDYVARVRQVALAEASKSGSAFALAAANSPYGPVVNQAYAILANAAEVPTNKPATPAPKPAATVPIGDRYAKQTAPRVAAAPAPPPRRPKVQTNPYAAASPVVDTKAIPNAPRVASAATPAAPSLPAGSPPLGFDGYCPVTMKQNWEWKKGDARFGVIHRGRTYLFATAEQQQTFYKNPDTFAPVLSGVDPVVALEEGRAVPGLRRFAVEYEGKFYLFSSEQSLNKFWSDSDRYATGVRQAMATGTPMTFR